MTDAAKGAHRIPSICGDEMDALSRKAKGYMRWEPGERAKIKRKYNKRLRATEKAALKDGGSDDR